ncbi:MAG TPA: UMP kinase [Candidatus Dormibacteraeota bacterium]|nr:UMP kinase [Candidatus Dormibacteraeota bacterium]
MEPKYRRILLKLSGEAMLGDQAYGISPTYTRYMAGEIKKLHDRGIEVAVVVGGGNFIRGADTAAHGIAETTAHYMGMLATVINALALQAALEAQEVPTRVQTAIQMEQVAEPYIRRRAIRHLEKGRVVIMAAGTGNPFFTTDTAAALRAAEIDADVILMAKHGVDGVYSADPKLDKSARKYDELTYGDVLNRNLRVIDATAAAHANERRIPAIVFDLNEPDALVRAVQGERVGTLVHSG